MTPYPRPYDPRKFLGGWFLKIRPPIAKNLGDWFLWDFSHLLRITTLTTTENSTEKSGLDFEGRDFKHFENRLDGHYKAIRNIQNLVKQVFMCEFSSFLPSCMECRRSLAMRFLSIRLSVRPSVCPSVTHVNCDKTVELSRFIYLRKII